MSRDDDIGYALGMRLPLDVRDRVELAAREVLASLELAGVSGRYAGVHRLRQALDAAAERRMVERAPPEVR